ncbi:MAG: type II secretion system protein [Bacillota bacterium]
MNVRGFTLIELLVVIAIIGILSAVVIASLAIGRVRAQDSTKLSDMHQVQTALELYYTAKGSYPIATDSAGQAGGLYWSTACVSKKYYANQPEDDCWDGAQAGSLGSQLKAYLPSMPVPPDNGQAITACNNLSRTSVYTYESNGKDYKIYAFLKAAPCPASLANDGGTRPEAYELFSAGGSGQNGSTFSLMQMPHAAISML